MQRFLYIFIFITLALQLSAQDLIWANRTGGNVTDVSHQVTLDAAGNVYHLGDFSATVDLDPGPGVLLHTGVGFRDIFLQKLDPAGNLIWAFSFGGSDLDMSGAVTVDAAGDVIIVGGFQDTVDFDPGPNTSLMISNGQFDVFIMKVDASGNFLWARSLGAADRDIARAVDTDANNNIYIAGSFYEAVDFDPGPSTQSVTAGGWNDGFVLMLDANGNFQWVSTLDGPDITNLWSVQLDPVGDIYLCGDFKGTVDFDPGSGNFNLTSAGLSDNFTAKLDNNGNLLWARHQGGTGPDYSDRIQIGNGNELYVTGMFSDTVDFDPGPGTLNLVSAGGYDVFVQKLDPAGNLMWVKRYGGSGDDTAEDLKMDAFGYLYLTGAFMDSVDFDPGTGTEVRGAAGNKDAYILKLSPSGQYRWVNTLSSSNRDWGASLALDGTNAIYTCGLFSNTVDFDPSAAVNNLSSAGHWDSFLQKLSNCAPISGVTSVTNCGPYLSPSGQHIWTTSGVFVDTLLTASGCDSLLTIRLTINENNTVAITDSSCGPYTLNGQTYTSSGTYQQTLPAASGCDTTVNLDLSVFTPPVAGFSVAQNGNQTLLSDNSSAGTSWLWDLGDGNTSTQQNPVHTYQQNGTYQVCLTVTTAGECTDQSCDQITVALVGNPEPTALQNLEIFPNPSQGNLFLLSSRTIKEATVRVFNAQGQELIHQPVSLMPYQKTSLALTGLANGIYLVAIQSKGDRVQRWIRIQE